MTVPTKHGGGSVLERLPRMRLIGVRSSVATDVPSYSFNQELITPLQSTQRQVLVLRILGDDLYKGLARVTKTVLTILKLIREQIEVMQLYLHREITMKA